MTQIKDFTEHQNKTNETDQEKEKIETKKMPLVRQDSVEDFFISNKEVNRMVSETTPSDVPELEDIPVSKDTILFSNDTSSQKMSNQYGTKNTSVQKDTPTSVTVPTLPKSPSIKVPPYPKTIPPPQLFASETTEISTKFKNFSPVAPTSKSIPKESLPITFKEAVNKPTPLQISTNEAPQIEKSHLITLSEDANLKASIQKSSTDNTIEVVKQKSQSLSINDLRKSLKSVQKSTTDATTKKHSPKHSHSKVSQGDELSISKLSSVPSTNKTQTEKSNSIKPSEDVVSKSTTQKSSTDITTDVVKPKSQKLSISDLRKSLKSDQKSTTDATIEKISFETLHSKVPQLDRPSTSKASSMPPDINLLDDDELPPVETEIVLIIDSDEENNETKREKEARKINKRADLRDALAQISNDDILTERKF